MSAHDPLNTLNGPAVARAKECGASAAHKPHVWFGMLAAWKCEGSSLEPSRCDAPVMGA